MASDQPISSQLYIQLEGSKVSQAVLGHLIEVQVDQHVHVPDMFTIRLRDPDLELLDDGPFDLTKEVAIVSETAVGEKVLLVQGEITALEPQFDANMIAELVVRGYDRSHRLYRETKSRAFINHKDSDLARKIAEEQNLESDIETTSVVYEHVY
jgi:uncharacterized protein